MNITIVVIGTDHRHPAADQYFAQTVTGPDEETVRDRAANVAAYIRTMGYQTVREYESEPVIDTTPRRPSTLYAVQYNTKSLFGPALSSGSTQVSAASFAGWVATQLETGWPVIITDMKEI